MRTYPFISMIVTMALGCAGGSPTWDQDGDGDDPGGDDMGGDDVGGGMDDDDDDDDFVGPANPTAFRVRTMAVRDPHVFVNVFGTCYDITDAEVAGMSVNSEFRKAIENDAFDTAGNQQADGLLDLSMLVIFRPLIPSAPTSEIELAPGACTAPLSGTRCSRADVAPSVVATAANQASGSCMSTTPGTGGYAPGITLPNSPCFHGGPLQLQLGAAGVTMTLQAVEGAASYQGDPATGLVNGVLKGFLREADANATIPTPIGDMAFSSFLPGGAGSCAPRDDRDVGPDGSRGWYVYMNFTADPVEFSE